MCVNGNLSLDFGEDKTKCFLFSKEKYRLELNIIFDNNRTKQFHIVELMDANLSGESMAIKSLKKISTKLEFLWRQISL